LLSALGRLGRTGGESAYIRLSTRPIDQALASMPEPGPARDARRAAVLGGGYRLREAEGTPQVVLAGMGAVMPQVIAAADELSMYDIRNDVVCITSPDLVNRALQTRQGVRPGDESVLRDLFPRERFAPIVTVIDGHPHTLSFLAGIGGAAITSLGVEDFGQSGDVEDLYRYYGIDTETIVGAALDLI
jgi:pyruvate dehydrogenase E1 component